MGNYGYIVEQIKERVPLADAVQRYTQLTPKRGKICCPLHGEKTASFAIYPHNNTFYCFGCGASGDVIGFVRQYFNLDFVDALRRIDTDFALCLMEKPTLTEYRRQMQAVREREKRQQEERERAEQIEAQYWAAFDTVLRYEQTIERLCPASLDVEPDPAFVEAIKNIEHARHALECAEQERRKQQNADHRQTDRGNDSKRVVERGNVQPHI